MGPGFNRAKDGDDNPIGLLGGVRFHVNNLYTLLKTARDPPHLYPFLRRRSRSYPSLCSWGPLGPVLFTKKEECSETAISPGIASRSPGTAVRRALPMSLCEL
ncbi:hypothetical protein BD779DRAFT_1473369 [Infundibulicybe gibba]|nr:hypothetical protein BD779DRAFT_1473369 [Infundibulicybe gibba]